MLEETLDIIDDALERGHGCCRSEELFCIPVREGRSFWDLCAANSPIVIPREVLVRITVAFDRMPVWEDLDGQCPDSFEAAVNGGAMEDAPSIAWAHAQAQFDKRRSMACITHRKRHGSGQLDVLVGTTSVPLWFVSTARDCERYFRWLIIETTSSPGQMKALAASAFRDLQFVDGVFDGIKSMSKPYTAIAPAIVAHLAAFSDEGRRIFDGPRPRVAAEFGALGIDISDENGNTKGNRRARNERTLLVDGEERVFGGTAR